MDGHWLFCSGSSTSSSAERAELSLSLLSLPRLTELNIGDLNFQDEGMAKIFKALGGDHACPLLERLHIHYNDLTHRPLRLLGQVLKGKANFQYLKLTGNEIGNKGTGILASVLDGCGSLGTLSPPLISLAQGGCEARSACARAVATRTSTRAEAPPPVAPPRLPRRRRVVGANG